MRLKKKVKALSLIELLVVISILGILSVLIAIPISAQLQKARDGKRKIDVNIIQKGLEEYYDSTGCYPERLPECGKVLGIGTNKFIEEVPCDPKNKSFYPYITTGENCSPFFKLYAKLERVDDPNIKTVGCINGCGPNCAYNFGVSSPNVSLDYCEPPITPIPTETPSPTPKPPTPTLTITPKPTSIPTPTPVQYVCAPAAGPHPEGQCESYAVPTLSECPKIYPNDPTCQYECYLATNRCKNAKGKFKQFQ